MQISYTYENVNLLIVLIGLIIIIHIITLRKIEKRTIKFANYETLKKVIGYEILHKNYLPLILRLLAMFLIIVGISNLTLTIINPVSDTDYVFAIDTSSSMLTSDNGTFEPSRLEAAKDSAINLLNKVPGNTNIGIVTFAGKSHVKSEPTNDHKELKQILHKITFDPEAGTSIGNALITSSGLLTNTSKKRVITLITDGRNNRGVDIEESLKYVITNNITVYTIGVGLRNGTTATISDTELLHNLRKTNATAAEFQELNITELKNIANQTHGSYFFVTNKEELNTAFESAVLDKDTTKMPLVKYVLLIAALLLLLEWSLGATKYKTIP